VKPPFAAPKNLPTCSVSISSSPFGSSLHILKTNFPLKKFAMKYPVVLKDLVAISSLQLSTRNSQPFPIGTFALKFFAGNAP
jgi:hypothetical protein